MSSKFLEPIVGVEYYGTMYCNIMTVTKVENKVVYLEGVKKDKKTGKVHSIVRYCDVREFGDFYTDQKPISYKGGTFHKKAMVGDATHGIVLLPSIQVTTTNVLGETYEVVCADKQNREQLIKVLTGLGGKVFLPEGDRFLVTDVVYTKPVEAVYGK